MNPGPDQIVACPHCGALEFYWTFVSWNTSGAKLFSDGELFARMKVDPPPYVECHSCHDTYWLENAKEIGTVSWKRDPESIGETPSWKRLPDNSNDVTWVEAPEIKFPSAAKMYEAIDRVEKTGPADELRKLRILAWRKRNNPYRRGDKELPELTAHARKNLENLADELGREDGTGKQVTEFDRLMVAELMRELGRFDSALEMLEGTVWNELRSYAGQIKEQCRLRNPRVIALT